jgi:hypothetical protein
VDNLLSSDILSVLVAYALTLAGLRMLAGFVGGANSPMPAEPHSMDDDTPYEAPRRRSLTALALVVPVLGVLWMALGTSPHPPWTDLYGESLSDLGYVLGFAMLFPSADIVGLATRRAKLWTATAAFLVGSVLVYAPQLQA